MNKFQKSLHEIINATLMGMEDEDVSYFEVIEENFNNMAELVKKETPMKPIHLYENRYSCDNCAMVFNLASKVRFVNNQYCDVCGQKIDWSDEG